MAPRGKKLGPPKKDGCQPESLADTPLLKGKPPVTKPQIKKKTPATGDSKGPPPSLASGASPTPQPPHSYAVAARTSMDTSEPMDIEQLCTMWPQHSGTPPAATNTPSFCCCGQPSQDQPPWPRPPSHTSHPGCCGCTSFPSQLLSGCRGCRRLAGCCKAHHGHQCCWPQSWSCPSWPPETPPLCSEGSATSTTSADDCEESRS